MNNYIGEKYGRWTVIRNMGSSRLLCKCECGTIKVVNKSNLLLHKSKSCGCLRKELIRKNSHGLSKTRLYRIWTHMKERCTKSYCKEYRWYGARGITFCEEWRDFLRFYRWANTNGYDDDLTLERINVNGDYEPSNCTWIPMEMQSRNTRTTRFIEANGERKCLSEWAEITGINASTISARIDRYGWSTEQALSTHKKKRG